jgi:hypothetical protein
VEEVDGLAPAEHRRREVFVRASIFVALGAVAQASAALPPGPNNVAFYWASLAVFVVAAASLLLLWR